MTDEDNERKRIAMVHCVLRRSIPHFGALSLSRIVMTSAATSKILLPEVSKHIINRKAALRPLPFPMAGGAALVVAEAEAYEERILQAWLKLERAYGGVANVLNPGISEQSLKEVEDRLGVQMPHELAWALKVHNGLSLEVFTGMFDYGPDKVSLFCLQQMEENNALRSDGSRHAQLQTELNKALPGPALWFNDRFFLRGWDDDDDDAQRKKWAVANLSSKSWDVNRSRYEVTTRVVSRCFTDFLEHLASVAEVLQPYVEGPELTLKSNCCFCWGRHGCCTGCRSCGSKGNCCEKGSGKGKGCCCGKGCEEGHSRLRQGMRWVPQPVATAGKGGYYEIHRCWCVEVQLQCASIGDERHGKGKNKDNSKPNGKGRKGCSKGHA